MLAAEERALLHGIGWRQAILMPSWLYIVQLCQISGLACEQDLIHFLQHEAL
jgi:hypothetical protein